MQDKIELHRIQLALLNQQIEKIEAERDGIQNDIQSIRALVSERTENPLWNGLPVATISVLMVISLSFIFVYHNALSKVNNDDPIGETVLSGFEPAQIIREQQKPRYSRKKVTNHQQWGPLLVMSKPDERKRYYGFDPQVKAQQEDLLTLGFKVGKADGYKGERTRQAIAEFRALYLPDSGRELQDTDLAAIIESYANLARSDAAEFGIDQGVVAAIRLSSVRTGVDFTYLMKLAATESNFSPAIKAPTSSATGLYQFTRDTWLTTLKTYGVKYGLVADYAENIQFKKTRSGYQRPVVSDEKLYKHLLELRKNPRLSAMMAAETVRDSQQNLAQLFNREPTETDLYLTHFLGTDDAVTFLHSLEQNPGTKAVELFPVTGQNNLNNSPLVTIHPMTIDVVYAFFGKMLHIQRTGLYVVT
mgnify:CR=1 FL=1